jgi:hypothetical protein
MEPEEHARRVSKIIAKAWIDEGFKARLLADPATTLKEEGLEISPGVKVQIVEDTANVQHLLLPAKPSTEELSEVLMTDVTRFAVARR